MQGDSTGKSCLMPCGCADVAWVGPAADHVAVACDDGNVVVLALVETMKSQLPESFLSNRSI